MKKISQLFASFFFLIVSVSVLVVVLAVAALLMLPDVGQLEKCFVTSMFQVRLCPTSENYVQLKQISPYMVHALISAEDGSFYSHEGFDWHEMEESLNANLRSGKIRRGGSTLTQQLAKNVFLDKEKSFLRKVKEAYLAYAIERRFTKDFILEKYLNVVEFGPKLYGIKPASHHYFQKSPSELNPLEAAYLAHLLPNPKAYSRSFASGTLTPFNNKMVKVILRRMASFGKLSRPGYDMALAQLSNFPWNGIDRSSFQGAPTYSLDAGQSILGQDPVADEDALDEVLREQEAIESDPAEDDEGYH